MSFDPIPVLVAMSATHIPRQSRGDWRVSQVGYEKAYRPTKRLDRAIPAGVYTLLMNKCNDPVMTDDPMELATHLDFIRRARGNVLVTGLGLGCVLRGLAAYGRCDAITVVEREQAVIDLVWPHVGCEARLVVADAITWEPDEDYDCVWHDLWSDPERNEPLLQLTHHRLMERLKGRVAWQSAWAAHRAIKRMYA